MHPLLSSLRTPGTQFPARTELTQGSAAAVSWATPLLGDTVEVGEPEAGGGCPLKPWSAWRVAAAAAPAPQFAAPRNLG
jgi:hypothetical protein